MTRDNLLFSIIGILLGFIVGFMFASNMSQRAPAGTAPPASQELPADHPDIDSEGQNTPGQMQAEVTRQIEKAKQSPNDFDAQINAADMYYQIQRYDSAIEYLLKANKIRPDDYRTLVLLGNVNLDAGQFDVAEKWYRAALAKKPDDVAVLGGLCVAALEKGDAKAAEEAIAKIEKIDANAEGLTQLKERVKSLKSSEKSK